MSKIEQFYNALVKDPDLNIKPGQTREQAARQEATHRSRQYDNNSKALAMATTPDESPINSLLDHVEQMTKSMPHTVLIKAVEEYSKNEFIDMFNLLFSETDVRAKSGWSFGGKTKELSDKQKQNLATNISEYTDPNKEGISDINEEAT